MNIEQALRKTAKTEKFRDEVSKKVNNRVKERTLAEKEEVVVREAREIVEDASSFTNKDRRQTVEHNRGRRTSAGDGLPHGPRGGRYGGGKGFDRLR